MTAARKPSSGSGPRRADAAAARMGGADLAAVSRAAGQSLKGAHR